MCRRRLLIFAGHATGLEPAGAQVPEGPGDGDQNDQQAQQVECTDGLPALVEFCLPLGFGVTNGDQSNPDDHAQQVLDGVEAGHGIPHNIAFKTDQWTEPEVKHQSDQQLYVNADQSKEGQLILTGVDGAATAFATGLEDSSDEESEYDPAEAGMCVLECGVEYVHKKAKSLGAPARYAPPGISLLLAHQISVVFHPFHMTEDDPEDGEEGNSNNGADGSPDQGHTDNADNGGKWIYVYFFPDN